MRFGSTYITWWLSLDVSGLSQANMRGDLGIEEVGRLIDLHFDRPPDDYGHCLHPIFAKALSLV